MYTRTTSKMTYNLDLLPPKLRLTFRNMKKRIQEFHRKSVLAPAYKEAKNVVVISKYTTVTTEGKNSALLIPMSEICLMRVMHRCHMAAKFGVFVEVDNSKIPTFYWLLKIHKTFYKSALLLILTHVLFLSCLMADAFYFLPCCD